PSSSATLSTPLVLVTIGLPTVLPFSFVLIHGLIIICLGPSILVTDSTLIDQSWIVSDLRKSDQMLHLGT
ncbi:hypothetical protein A2U01_0100696, partial [Trifolium medium]|nr:hypothetical protein [Trifolium medium]